MDEIKAICEKHGATIIEDAAESLGATYKGVQTGTFGKYNAIPLMEIKLLLVLQAECSLLTMKRQLISS